MEVKVVCGEEIESWRSGIEALKRTMSVSGGSEELGDDI